MATVVGDTTDIRLEFTSFELDLMREIAFNTGKTLDQVAAERLQHGVICEQPGEQDEFELRYTPENAHQNESPKINLEELGITAKEDAFRDRIQEILVELYNIAWSRGTHTDKHIIDEEARKLHVALRVDMIMQEVYDYEP